MLWWNMLKRNALSPRSHATACRPRHRSCSAHNVSSDARSSSPKSTAFASARAEAGNTAASRTATRSADLPILIPQASPWSHPSLLLSTSTSPLLYHQPATDGLLPDNEDMALVLNTVGLLPNTDLAAANGARCNSGTIP
jgi:hypothetical protein